MPPRHPRRKARCGEKLVRHPRRMIGRARREACQGTKLNRRPGGCSGDHFGAQAALEFVEQILDERIAVVSCWFNEEWRGLRSRRSVPPCPMCQTGQSLSTESAFGPGTAPWKRHRAAAALQA